MGAIQSSVELLDRVSDPMLAMLDAITRVTAAFDKLSEMAERTSSAFETMQTPNATMQETANQTTMTAASMNAVSDAAQNAAASVQQTAVAGNAAAQEMESVKSGMALTVQSVYSVGSAIAQAEAKFSQFGTMAEKVSMNNLSCLNQMAQQENHVATGWTNISAAAQRSGKSVQNVCRSTSASTQKVESTARKAAAAYQIVGNSVSESMHKANQNMQKASVATESMTRAQRRLADAEAKAAMKQEELNRKVRATGDSTENNTQKQRQFNNSVQACNDQYNALLSKVKSVAAAIVSIQGIKMTLGLSDDLANAKARIDMITGSAQETKQVQDQIFSAANRARGSYLDMTNMVGKLTNMAGEAFSSTDETIAFAEQLNKLFVISNMSASEIKNSMIQLNQALASGVLRGDELNSVLEQSPGLTKALNSYLGTTTSELRNIASEGAVTANVVKSAVLSSINETNASFETMPMTFSQVMTQIKNYALRAFQPVLERFTELANSQDFQMMIQSVIQGLAVLGNVAVIVMDKMASGAAWVRKNWETIKPVLETIVIVLGALAAAVMVVRAAQVLYNLATSPMTWVALIITALIVLFVMFTDKVLGALNVVIEFGRQSTLWLINIQLAAATVFNNINKWCINLSISIFAVIKNINTWCINLSLAIIAIFKNVGIWAINTGIGIYTVIQNINKWCTNLSFAIFSIVKNVNLWFYNCGLGIQNVLYACANNVGVAFNNAWCSVEAGFLSMVEAILSKAEDLLGGINSLLPEDYQIGGGGLSSALDAVRAGIDDANSAMKEYQSLSDAWDKGFHTYDEYVDVSAAYQTYGYDSVSDAFHTFDYDSIGDAYHTFDYDSVGDAFHTFDYDSVGDAFHTFDVFQDGWASDAYNTGAEVGAGLHDKITGIWDKIKGLGSSLTGNGSDDLPLSIDPNDYLGAGLLNAADDVTDASDGLADSMNALAESNAELNDTVSMSDDMMQYMRDIAERDTINRFTTAEIKVEFQANNTISSDMDIDGVVSALESKVQQSLVAAAEGVHL